MEHLTMKNIFIITVLFIFSISLPTVYSQDRPEWLDELQVFKNGSGYYIHPSPIMNKVNFTGNGWGVYFPNRWGRETLELEINAWHSKNAIYIAYAPTYQLYYDLPIPVPDEHRLHDINGNFVNHKDTGARAYTICSEQWQAYVKSEMRKAIDLGVDGFQFDGAQCPPIHMCKWQSQPASFDSVTMAHFRNYLNETYSADRLSQEFDITSIETFNYANWIKAHGMEDSWNNEPFTGIAAEFFKFMILATKDYFHNIAEDVRNYAMNTYGKSIILSCNPNFGALGYYLIEDMDYFNSEHFPFQENDPFAHTDIKSTKCIENWPVFVIPEPKGNIPQKTNNMIRLFVADIYASGGQIGLEETFRNYREDYVIETEYDFDIYAKYVNFILSNRDLYEDLIPVSSVGLLNSHSSRMARYWPVEGDADVDYSRTFYGTGKLLTDSNIQFDGIFAPDERFTSTPSFTIEQLRRYEVIVLPHTFELTDQQVQILLDFMQEGGILVAMGNIGTNNLDGTLANRPELILLQQDDGVKSYGAGKFVYTLLKLGDAYVSDRGISHNEVRRRFQSMILPHITPYIKTCGLLEVYRPGGATGFLYNDLHGNYILHLVNYDYNEINDEFSVKENFELKILADTTKSWEAVYVSPDIIRQQILPSSSDSGYIRLTIPKLEAYGIIILQQNSTAPQIVSRTPLEDVTILAGDSLHFSVSAKDPDNNLLFYQWYINGLIDTLCTDSIYVFATSHESSDVDTLRVEVTDGRYKVNTQWLINFQSYIYPRIIFDETHNQYFTPRLSQAIEILKLHEGENYDPSHIDWVLCDKLINKLRKDYIVTSDTTGTLILPTLQDANVLFIVPFGKDLSYQEREGIIDFIGQGGNMLILGLSGWELSNEVSNANFYHLLSEIGFKTHLPVVASLDDTLWKSSVFMVDLVGSHPATSYADKIQFSNGHKLETTKDFSKIIETTGNLKVWEDINNNYIKDANEPLQSNVGIIGVSEYGKGKVVYIGTSGNFNDTASSPTQNVIISVMKWLTENVNQLPTLINSNIDIPKEYSLYQNYPNPFNTTTVIKFQVPKTSRVILKVYNMLGQEIITLVEKSLSPGTYTSKWDGFDCFGKKVTTGLYFYRVEIENYVEVKKCLLLK